VIESNRNEETGMVLVATLLGELQKQVLKGVSDIAELNSKLDTSASKLDRIHEEVKFTNGRVTEIETWRDGLQDESTQAASYAAGRKSRESEYHERVNFVWKTIWTPAWRVIGAVVLLTAGWFSPHLADFLREVMP